MSANQNGGGDKSKTEPPASEANPNKAGVSPAPIVRFVVECADARNSSTIPLDTLRLRLRGRWRRSNIATQDIGDVSKIPDCPGICIEVNSRDRAVRIFDPLGENEALMERINKTIADIQAIKTGNKLKPWPTATHELDEDQFKSVLLEIARKVHDKPERSCMEAVRGDVPQVKQLTDFPGRELYDPWSNSTNKPKYVDQLREWEDRWSNLSKMMAAFASVGAE